MPTSFSSSGQFVRGCLGRNGRLLLQFADRALTKQRAPHPFFMTGDNGRLSPPVRCTWTAVAVVFTDWADIEFMAVGEAGQLLRFSRDGTTTEVGMFASTASMLR